MTSQYQHVQHTVLEKLPPHHLEAEQAILGAILLDDRALSTVSALLTPDDFYRPSHAQIYRALFTLWERGDGIDLLVLRNELARMKQLENAGGPAYLAMLVDVTPTAANVRYHAQLVHEAALARTILNTAMQLVERVYLNDEAVLPLLENAKQTIDALYRQSRAHQPDIFWTQTRQGRADAILLDEFLQWLEQQGFALLEHHDALLFVRATDTVICEVKWYKSVCRTIKRRVKEFCVAMDRRDVWKKCLDQSKLFSYQLLTGLNVLTRPICRDTADTCYLYFQNGAVRMTATTVAFLPYDTLPGLVWQESMSPHAYAGRFNRQIRQILRADLTRAMKTQDVVRRRVLRYLLSEIARKEYQLPPGERLSDVQIAEDILAGFLLDCETVMQACTDASRRALWAETRAEFAIVQAYYDRCDDARSSEYEQVISWLAQDELKLDDATTKTILNLPGYEFALAHLAHQHNDPVNARAVVFADSNPTLASNGRRGKKIILEAFKYLRGKACVVKEDGKAFNDTGDNRFVFQRVSLNTRLLILDDVKEHFDFKSLYSAITDGLVVESKGAFNKRFAFEFEENPKIAITTNHPCFGDDVSSTDRAVLLPVSDYFRRVGKTPRQLFGHTLYEDWDDAEWARFYDYFIQIIQQYLQRPDPSVVPLVDLTIFNAHKLLLYVPEAIIDHLDKLKRHTDYEFEQVKLDLEATGVKFKSTQEYSSYLHTYCTLRGLTLHKNTKDGRYKVNGKRYLRLIEQQPPLPGVVYAKP